MTLIGHIRRVIAADGELASHKLVVTAGGTREAIDPVRFITNRSTGKQGYAIAQAAVDAGADVVLISSAAGLPAPIGVMHWCRSTQPSQCVQPSSPMSPILPP